MWESANNVREMMNMVRKDKSNVREGMHTFINQIKII